MPLRIAIIGWGSLIWDPRELPRDSFWQLGGPVLTLEYSRISNDCRLTLVIDPDHGEKVPTRFVLSSRSNLDDAIEDLRKREGTVRKWIGFVNIKTGENSSSIAGQAAVHNVIEKWCRENHFDSAVWTALPSTFEQETGREFSLDNAIEYLRGLPTTARERAFTYISNAPGEVMTSLRRKLLELDMIPE